MKIEAAQQKIPIDYGCIKAAGDRHVEPGNGPTVSLITPASKASSSSIPVSMELVCLNVSSRSQRRG